MSVDTDAPAGGNRSPGVVQAARKAKGEVGGAYATPIKALEVVNLNSRVRQQYKHERKKEEEDAPIKASEEEEAVRIKGAQKRIAAAAKAARLKKDQQMQYDDNIGFLYMLGIVAVCLFINQQF